MPASPVLTVHPHGRTPLTPNHVHRDAVHLRDDYRCLAARSAWSVITPCSPGLALHPAHPAADSPALLRTFCVAHATAATLSADFAAACLRYGWTLPTQRIDPARYAAVLPVRYSDGLDYRLDAWGDRTLLELRVARADRIRLGLIDRRLA